MKNYVKVAAFLGLSAATLCASGWRIPEQSLNGTALGTAYVANANGADASYYNPANMVWMDEYSRIETAMTYINLTNIKYTDVTGLVNNSTEEHFYLPTFHYVSSPYENWRFGLSVVVPGGLSKRWEDAYAKSTAEEFTIKIMEINPNVAYKVNDKLSLAFGLRGIYITGIIKAQNEPFYKNDMEADSIEFGYNLALSYKPIKNLTLATTYRSNVDLNVNGDANGNVGAHPFSTSVEAMMPLPAVLTLAAAYTMDKTTIEFVFERTYWSRYKEINFNFGDKLLDSNLGKARPKNWEDVNAYRIGVTHKYSNKLTLMAGFSIDKNPAPSNTIGFEMPDSDAKLYSCGIEYKVNNDMKIGLAYLYDQKESRTINNRRNQADINTGVNGKYEDAAAHLLTLSLKYKF